MSKARLAGAFAFVAAPLLALIGVAVAPTVSDAAADQVAALVDHRSATILSLALQTVAIAVMIGGIVWLAHALAHRTPRLALAGGILGVAGSLVVLFESGITAAAPAVVHGLGTGAATSALDRVDSSAAVSALEPLSLLNSLGLALLAFAATRAGASRWAAAAVAIGAFGEGVGFATGTRPLVLAAFAVLLVGAAAVATAVAGRPRERAAAGEAVALS